MDAGAFSSSSLDRLPSGRHSLSVADVRQSQRGRLLAATVQVVAEKGYAATTVAQIVERANVSRTTFYEQFQDKETCFLAAFDFGVEFVLARMRAAWSPDGVERDWRDHVRSDLTAFLQTLADEPAFARALHLEVLGAGPAALDRRAQVFGLFTQRTAAIHALARAQDSSIRPLPVDIFKLHTAGFDEFIREHIRTSGTDSLPGLAAPLHATTLALFGAQPADSD